MIIVSGLPRSGTSLLCQLLEGAGFKVADDGKREPDEYNPYGYYEIKNPYWATGYDAVKVVIPQIAKVFKQHKIILMQRGIESISMSMGKMLNDKIDIEALKGLWTKGEVLIGRRFRDVLKISFEKLIKQDVETVNSINEFIGEEIDTRVIHTRH